MGQQSLNAITAPDQYTVAATIEDVPIAKMVIDVVNAAIYWQPKIAVPQGGNSGCWDGTETYLIPSSKQITRPDLIGVRVRAAIPAAQLPSGGLQAVVTVNVTTI